MMAKYRGKYDKCRTCQNAKEVMMFLVVVDNDCPNKREFSSGLFVDKNVCQNCEDWSVKK